jgi:glycosyltransferase involved in cell wall biosynthesis
LLVSVIIPAYNAEDNIIKTIDSVICQDYKNIEIIVVNDGSQDGTQLVLEKYEREIITINTINNGVAKARQIGLSASSGKYILFLDSDDTLLPNSITLLMNSADNDNSIDVIVGQSEVECLKKNTVKTNFKKIKDNALENFLYENYPFTFWPALYRKTLFENIPLNNGFSTGEDFVTNCSIYSNGPKVNVIENVVHKYTRGSDSITNNMTSKKYKDNFLAFSQGLKIIEKHEDEKIQLAIYHKSIGYCFSLLLARSPYFIEAVNSMKKNRKKKSIGIYNSCFSLKSNTFSFLLNQHDIMLSVLFISMTFFRDFRK